jgi:hypothetical protein
VRQIEVGERDVTSQAVAWDLERNLRITVESKRRITGKSGKRYSDDMIIVTQNANASIVFRNAVLRVIPRVYIDRMYDAARKCAVGDLATLPAKRTKILARLSELGVAEKRVLATLSKASVEDVLVPDLEVLIGLGTSIRDGLMTIADAFPEPAAPAADLAATNGRESMKPQDASAPVTQPAPQDTPAIPSSAPEAGRRQYARRGRPETGIAGTVTVIDANGQVIAQGEREPGADDEVPIK